jgi:hypothetical protein
MKNKIHMILVLIFTCLLCKIFSNEANEDCTIPNCEECNRQIKYESCYRCKEGFFVLPSGYFKKDECVRCDTIINHCTSCSYYDSIICLACENGYELIKDRFKDDKCVPHLTFLEK